VSAETARTLEIAEEDLWRAQIYALLGKVLAAAPGPEVLADLGRLKGDESDFGRAIVKLAQAARATTPQAAADEFGALFIGLTQGELLPYGSYYLAGFLHEKPLARLRADMARLGMAGREEVSEPEDHIAALCEMMMGLITGAFGAPADLATQRRFFDTHVASWAGRFFGDLDTAKQASLYRPVGTIGRLFVDIESQAFDMAA
jgi:TorA maturation chaperone TorD